MGAESTIKQSVSCLNAPEGYHWQDDPNHPSWAKRLVKDDGETVGILNKVGHRKLASGAPQDRQKWVISKPRAEVSDEGYAFEKVATRLATLEKAAETAIELLLKS